MRKRNRKKLIFHNSMIFFLFIIPFVPIGVYFGGATNILDECSEFNYYIGVNTTDFIEPDYDQMAEWAEILDARFEEIHMPTGIALRCTFTDIEGTDISYYHSTDNVGLSTGLALATYCFKYKAAKDEGNTAQMEQALRIIKGLVGGFSMMLAVPNGGIGPEYPGLPSRFYWAPENRDVDGFEHITNWMTEEHERHYNGSGIYKDYRWRSYTSKDEMGGYFFGLGRCLELVDDDWVQERVGLLTAQLIEGFIKTNWEVISGDGNPAGTDLKNTLFSGEWVLSLLNMGKKAYPEIYGELYYEYAAKSQYMNMAIGNNRYNTIMDYYANSFGHKNVFNLIMLEQDPALKKWYVEQYINGMYDNIRFHRVPYFNMMYLVFSGDDNQSIRDDIFDQLMRFEAYEIEKYGAIRNLNATARPSWHQKNPEIEHWREQLASNPIYSVYQPLTIEFSVVDKDSRAYYLQPLRTENWINSIGNYYGSNPFQERGSTYGNGLSEGCGNTFTVVYWMGRAYGLIPPPNGGV